MSGAQKQRQAREQRAGPKGRGECGRGWERTHVGRRKLAVVVRGVPKGRRRHHVELAHLGVAPQELHFAVVARVEGLRGVQREPAEAGRQLGPVVAVEVGRAALAALGVVAHGLGHHVQVEHRLGHCDHEVGVDPVARQPLARLLDGQVQPALLLVEHREHLNLVAQGAHDVAVRDERVAQVVVEVVLVARDQRVHAVVVAAGFAASSVTRSVAAEEQWAGVAGFGRAADQVSCTQYWMLLKARRDTSAVSEEAQQMLSRKSRRRRSPPDLVQEVLDALRGAVEICRQAQGVRKLSRPRDHLVPRAGFGASAHRSPPSWQCLRKKNERARKRLSALRGASGAFGRLRAQLTPPHDALAEGPLDGGLEPTGALVLRSSGAEARASVLRARTRQVPGRVRGPLRTGMRCRMRTSKSILSHLMVRVSRVRKGSATLVCHDCGDLVTRFLMVSRR